MVLKVFRYGEKVLREKAAPVAAVTDALRALADDMVETMHDSRGVGLATQQVGRTERLCVIDMPPDCDDDEDRAFNAPIAMPLKMFNPEIVSRDGAVCDKEGCLSFPGVGGEIVRAAQVVCRYVDERGVFASRPIQVVPPYWEILKGMFSEDPEIMVSIVGDKVMVGGSTANVERFAGVVETKAETKIEKDKSFTVQEMLVEVGDYVEEGQVLFVYDLDRLKLELEKEADER